MRKAPQSAAPGARWDPLGPLDFDNSISVLAVLGGFFDLFGKGGIPKVV